MAKNKRIYQVAIELNISHSDIIDFLNGIGEMGYSHMSEVNPSIYNKIISKYSKDKKKQEVYAKEKARHSIHNSRISDSLDSNDNKNDKQLKKTIEKKTFDDRDDLNRIGLKIIERPSSNKEDNKDTKEDSLFKKDKIESKKSQPQKQKMTLKKVNIEAIADKINQNKSKGRTGATSLAAQSLQISGKSSKKKRKKNKSSENNSSILSAEENVLNLPEFSTLEELSKSMNIKVQDAIMKCMDLGMMATINQRLDMDSMIMIADEFGFEIKEAEIDEIPSVQVNVNKANYIQKQRPPVVTVMGHVDHGKTSLLDYIRNENVVAGESGGITQHIGAYKVSLKNQKTITFLDTPGHEAFTAMRSRGAKVTDIVILVVAADDSVMPQTIEAIDHSQAASVPIIIAINKIDKPGSDPDRVIKQLSDRKILIEDWGGKYQSQLISAKTGQGIDKLLEKATIEAEVLDLKSTFEGNGQATIIESRLDKGLGPIATILVNSGSINKGDIFTCGGQSSKIRSILNERGEHIETAYPSDPVQILGFEFVPNAGEIFDIFDDEKEAKKLAIKRSQLKREAEHHRFRKTTLDQIGKQISEGKVKDLNILIKGDVDGSLEALSDSLMGISTDEVNVKIIHRSVGTINENDISLAKASNAIIILFNLPSSKQIKAKAKENGVEIRSYSVIYEAINEVTLALEGLLEPDKVEETLGLAEVRDSFKIPKIGIIAGCYITQGKVVKNAYLRVKRSDEIIHEGNLTSLKRFKDDVSEVLESYECGIGVEGFKKFENGDIIEVYDIKEIKRKL